MSQPAQSVKVIPLEAVRDTDQAAVGAKAACLARMMRAGLPVPAGFCVKAAAYREHLAVNNLLAETEETVHAGPEDRPRILSALRRAIAEAQLSGSLRSEVERAFGRLGQRRVAVRSSATAEDLPGHSFAGQHESYLGVIGPQGCLDAVKRCWASLWTERAFEYRARSGFDHLKVNMAVVVQRLVPAEVSGVLFGADPVSQPEEGRSDRLIIEGSFGLGEAVVQGRVSPDRIVLSKKGLRILERRVSVKGVEIVPDETGGVREKKVAPARAEAPCMDDAAARRLGKLALKAERLFGSPQDIEWAARAGKLYILQARPITAMPRERSREDRQVWTNANTGEVLPDVITPAAWSVARNLVTQLFNGVLGRLGVEFGDNPLVGRVAGRLYFNLNTFLGALRRLPALRQRDLGELFGGRQGQQAALGRIEISEEDIPRLNVSWLRTAFKLPGFVFWFLSHSPGEGRRFVARMRRETDMLWRVQPRSLSDDELADRVGALARNLVGGSDAIGFAAVGLMYSTTLFNICRRWFGREGDSIASRLLAGLGGMDNAEAGFELWRLAVLAHGHPEVERAMLSGEGFQALRRRAAGLDGGKEFLARWDGFMRRYGHHARGELEVSNARWSETPDYILDLLRGYVRGIGGDDPVARYGRLAARRERSAAECRRRLWNPVKRLVFSFVLRQAQRAAPIRENIKSELVRRIALGRFMLLELGGRLARRGVFDEREDVFFLELEELEPVRLGAAEFDVRETVARRRAEYERNLTITPPSVVVGRFDPDSFVPDEVDKNAEVLTGVAVSPGVVTGPARVITQAGTDQVLPGEILVAPFTDPGWTPYFLPAAAVVMDMGGILSHGSIIAREYGVPCVVNVGPATKIIKTGQMIRVDGDRGAVRILRARPITAVPRERSWEDRQVWTNANSGEVFPDVISPLSWSVVQLMFRTIFRTLFEKIGLDVGAAPAIGLVAGRVYFNINTLLGAARIIPLARGVEITEILGGQQRRFAELDRIHIADEDIPQIKMSRLRALLGAPGFLLRFLWHTPERAELFLAAKRRKTDAFRRLAPRKLSEDELVRHIAEAAGDLLRTPASLVYPMAAMYFFSIFDKVCRRWFDDEDGTIARRLVAGLGGMRPAEAGLDLWRLAALAHEHAGLEEVVLSGESYRTARRRIAEEEGGGEFLAGWDAFMADHGHHTRGELEYLNPRWCERPDEVLATLRGYLRGIGEDDPVARHRRLAAERAELTRRCRAKLRNPIKRVVFDYLLGKAQRGSLARENVKDEAVRRMALVRLMLLELGERFAQRGVIESRDDIFFFAFEELEPVRLGEAGFDVRETVARRRTEYEKNMTITPPSVVVGRFDPDEFVPDEVDETAEVLEGLAASPGVATGPARVILQAGTDQVLPGEVLVAPFTDPGWTPYFLNAAAIVMDMGGMLSHGSIIAREYGIPAVVNVGPATKIIKTGQTVRVDGTRGVVRVLK